MRCVTPIAPDMLTLAEHILKSKETKFDPSKFVDRYEQAVLQLLEKKQQGMPAPMAAPFVAPTNVVSLMDALRGSIAEDAKAAAPKKTATPQPQKGKKRIAGQVELLLPIAGRKEPPKADSAAREPTQIRVAASPPGTSGHPAADETHVRRSTPFCSPARAPHTAEIPAGDRSRRCSKRRQGP
jgi:hypothetical protein